MNTISKKNRPAISDEGRENQVIAMAYDLAEQQIRDGTASSQVITHFLKLGSAREKMEREILVEQKKYMMAKTENLESNKRMEELYKEALDAFRVYNGNVNDDPNV